MKVETIIVYGALIIAAIFVAIIIIATLKAGSDEDDRKDYDEFEDECECDWF